MGPLPRPPVYMFTHNPVNVLEGPCAERRLYWSHAF